MALKRFHGRVAWLVAGVSMGIFAGIGVAAAVMYFGRPAAQPSWPQGLPLHASTASTSETMAIATGRIDDDVEGLFTLDFLTGDLQCFVLNPRTGKYVGWFKTNVTIQLPVEKGKKPQYLLSTGNWSPTGFQTTQRPCQCVCYVADANTGMAQAYYFPWVKGAASTGITQSSPMLTIEGPVKVRNISLRSE
jgi:hypothetical protein